MPQQFRKAGVMAASAALLLVIACAGGDTVGSPTSPSLTASTSPTVTVAPADDPVASPRPADDPPPPPPPPEGGQGCTPGYWKQPQHADSWPGPFTPSTPFSDVFEDAFPGKTLVEVLGTGGGGLEALGRHTVAALLNSASTGVSYDVSTSDVINAFNAAYPGGDYETLKNLLARFNEQGCPLS